MNKPLQHPLHQPRSLRLALALTLVGSSLLSGCIVVPGGRHRGGHGDGGRDGGRYGDGRPVAVAPAPQVEVIGVAPGPGYIWISGFWQLMGGRHVWIGGRWEGGHGRR